ncbi:MAG: hypothetical protein AAF481_02295 [Acidobacteriota bacterium]
MILEPVLPPRVEAIAAACRDDATIAYAVAFDACNRRRGVSQRAVVRIPELSGLPSYDQQF